MNGHPGSDPMITDATDWRRPDMAGVTANGRQLGAFGKEDFPICRATQRGGNGDHPAYWVWKRGLGPVGIPRRRDGGDSVHHKQTTVSEVVAS